MKVINLAIPVLMIVIAFGLAICVIFLEAQTQQMCEQKCRIRGFQFESGEGSHFEDGNSTFCRCFSYNHDDLELKEMWLEIER